MPVGTSVLFAAATRLGYDTIRAMVTTLLPGRGDMETLAACRAYEAASERFVETYGKQFGALGESFLAHDSTLQAALRSTFDGEPPLDREAIDGTSFDGSPPATEEALAFFVDAFRQEIRRDRSLARVAADQDRDATHTERHEAISRSQTDIEERIASVEALLDQRLPQRTFARDLADLRGRLGQVEGFDVRATATPAGTMVEVTPTTSSEPAVQTSFKFPASDEGRRLAREVRRFYEEGGSVTIPREAIDTFEVHEALRTLIGDQAPAWLRMQQTPSDPIPVRLDAVGEYSVSVGGLELRAWRKGAKQATFRTDKRDAAWLDLTLRPDQSITVRLRTEPAGHPVHRARQVVALWSAISAGATLELRHDRTNQRLLRVGEVPEMEPPLAALVDLLDALTEIEERFGVAFALPERLDDSLLVDALSIRDAVRTGVVRQAFDTFSFTAPDETAANVLRLFEEDSPTPVTLAYREAEYEILGHRLSIGPMTRYLGPLVLTEAARETIEESREQGVEEHPVVLTPSEDQPVVNYLLDFLGDAERVQYEEAFRGLPPQGECDDAEEEGQAIG